jgi:hypothetical protein
MVGESLHTEELFHVPPPIDKTAPLVSEWNFGVIAMVLLAALAIAALLVMPEVYSQ